MIALTIEASMTVIKLASYFLGGQVHSKVLLKRQPDLQRINYQHIIQKATCFFSFIFIKVICSALIIKYKIINALQDATASLLSMQEIKSGLSCWQQRVNRGSKRQCSRREQCRDCEWETIELGILEEMARCQC